MLETRNGNFNILQVDGGGIKGVIAARVLMELEHRLGKPLYEVFDLMSGTSTGAIICGALACGISAEEIHDIYNTRYKEIFSPRFLWRLNPVRGKYNRDKVRSILSNYYGLLSLGDLKTNLVVAAWGMCAKRTHFIKSWVEEDQKHSLLDAVSWSALSALYYFGSIAEPSFEWKRPIDQGGVNYKVGEVFQDGGQGGHNCTVQFGINEAFINDIQGLITMVSLGNGEVTPPSSYIKAKRKSFLKQLISFPFMARNESSRNQVLLGLAAHAKNENFNFYRYSAEIAKKYDKLDGIKHMSYYRKIAKEVFSNVDYSGIAADLVF